MTSDYSDADLLNEALIDGDAVDNLLLSSGSTIRGRSSRGQTSMRGRGRGSGRRGRPVRDLPARKPQQEPEFSSQGFLNSQKTVEPPVNLPRTASPVSLPEQVVSAYEGSLDKFIEEVNLPVRKLGVTPSNGNCFYEAIMAVLKHQEVAINSTDANQLRKEVVGSIRKHPQFENWLINFFYGSKRRFTDFIKKHLVANTFTDHDGLIVVNTAHSLNINIHIVGTSNTVETPYTVIKGSDNPISTVWLAYQQDTTDQREALRKQGMSEALINAKVNSGHYQALVYEISNNDPSNNIDDYEVTINDDIKKKIENEEKILNLLYFDGEVIVSSLNRLLGLSFTVQLAINSNKISILKKK